MNIQQLIKEAKTFGSAACNEGIHQWETDGGRACPRDLCYECSQTVYRCTSCGQYDYGDKGGPAWRDCFVNCKLE
jgi:hypothetical protein